MIVNDELKRIIKDVAVVYLKTLFQNIPGGYE
jgi:hypothetical protein